MLQATNRRSPPNRSTSITTHPHRQPNSPPPQPNPAAQHSSPPGATPAKPRIWTLAVWLTDAAGLSSANDSTQTTLAIFPTKPNENSSSSNNTSHSGPPNSGTDEHKISPSPAKPKLKVTVSLHKRKLLIRVTGPTSGKVRVSYTCSFQGKTIATGTAIVALKHKRLTATFKLPVRAARSTIRVSAKLNGEPAVSNTLRHIQDLSLAPRRRLKAVAFLRLTPTLAHQTSRE